MFEFNLTAEELITRRLRYLVQTEYDGSYAKMFEHIYGHTPDEGREKLFKAHIDRGNVNGTFIRRLAEKTKVGEVSFSRFFDVYVDNDELFGC